MPTIIGNSTIFGIGGNTGSTGNTGNPGPTGARGNLGSTAGPTGGTAIYISTVTFDSTRNRLTFVGSNGTNLSVLEGFTGSTGYYSDSRGISATIAAGYLSGLSGIIGGNTFEFLGICGAGTLISSLSADKTEILITPNVSASSAYYGSTLPNNYVAYTTSSFSATTTKIGVTGTNSILSFGLTADNGATGNSVKVFTDFNEIYFGITGGITLGFSGGVSLNSVVTGYDTGGLVLDLTKYTTYKTTAPIGITAFTSSGDTGAVQAYTFFIEGAEVWNFPKNVYFENTNSGICGYGFLNGMNIVHIWSDNAGLTFNAAFVARGVGEPNNTVYTSQIGSCCYSNGSSCLDYKTLRECNLLGGVFSPLKPCSQTCVEIGSCCSENTCYENTPKSVCAEIAGTYSVGSNCTSSPCISKTYDLIISEADLVVPKTNKLFTATIQTTDTDPVFVSFPFSILSDHTETFSAFSAILPDQTIIDDTTELINGTTLGFYFDNTNIPTISGSLGNLPILLKDNSGVTQKVKNIEIVYHPEGSGCSGCNNAYEISARFDSFRYCTDCYHISDDTGYFDVLQSQSGTINFCVSSSGCGFTLSVNCINVGSVTDINDCKITGSNNAVGSELCSHRDYNFLTTNCDTIDGYDCSESADINLGNDNLHCKGADATDGTSSYFNSYYFYTPMYTFLNDAGFNDPVSIAKIEQGLKSIISNSKKDNKPLLYNEDNMRKGITYNNYATCCSVIADGIPLPDFDVLPQTKRIFVYAIFVERSGKSTGIWRGRIISCTGHFCTSAEGLPCSQLEATYDVYYALVSASVDGDDNIQPPSVSDSCMVVIPVAGILHLPQSECDVSVNDPNPPYVSAAYLGELNSITDVQLNTENKKIWKINSNWFNRFDVFRNFMFYNDVGFGYVARWFQDQGNSPYVFTIQPQDLEADKVYFLKRTQEFDKYFLKPGYCNNGNFGSILCSNRARSACIFDGTVYGLNMNNNNTDIFHNIDPYCHWTDNIYSIILNVSSDKKSITPTLYILSTSGIWTKNTTASLFISRLDDSGTENNNTTTTQYMGNCPACYGTKMFKTTSGTTFAIDTDVGGKLTDSLFYIYFNNATSFLAKPIRISKKYIIQNDPDAEPIPEINFTYSVAKDPNNNIVLNLNSDGFINSGNWQLEEFEWATWWENIKPNPTSAITYNNSNKRTNDPEFLYHEISKSLSDLNVNTDSNGKEYINIYVLFSISMYREGNSIPDQLETWRAQEDQKIIRFYLETPSGLVAQSTIQNKKINNQCVAIDCSGIEFYCSGLKDC